MTQNKKIILNVLISAIAVVFIVTLFFREQIVHRFSGNQLTKESLWTKEAAKYFDRIGPGELKELLGTDQQVIVVDLRSRSEYAKAHIPKSKNIPMDELEARMLDELTNASLIVLYCECPTESSSNIGYRILIQDGYKPAVLAGGLTAWTAQGYAVESSPNPVEW